MVGKLISAVVGMVALVGTLFALDGRYEHQTLAQEQHQRIEKNAAQHAEDELKTTQRQILEIRLDLYRIKLERLRQIKTPTPDDQEEVSYLARQIAAIRAQLDGLSQ